MSETITGTITALDRVSNSRDGNPRYRVTVDGAHTALTSADAAVNYKISNSEYRGVPVQVTYLKGKIIDVETAPNPEEGKA